MQEEDLVIQRTIRILELVKLYDRTYVTNKQLQSKKGETDITIEQK